MGEQAKKAAHELNQKLLLLELHGTREADSYLIPPDTSGGSSGGGSGGDDDEDNDDNLQPPQLQRQYSILRKNPILHYYKSHQYRIGCFGCTRQGSIECEIRASMDR